MLLSTAEKVPSFPLCPAETFRTVRNETFGDAVTYFAVLLIVTAVLQALSAVRLVLSAGGVDTLPGASTLRRCSRSGG